MQSTAEHPRYSNAAHPITLFLVIILAFAHPPDVKGYCSNLVVASHGLEKSAVSQELLHTPSRDQNLSCDLHAVKRRNDRTYV